MTLAKGERFDAYEFCVNSVENIIAVMEGVLWMTERYVLDVLRQSLSNSVNSSSNGVLPL